MPLQERVQQSSERNRGTKKSIYIILYCAEYLQAFCAIEVMLCAGHAQRSLPCDHYTSSCTDDPWLICFFMSSAFFAINAFVLKQLFSVFFSLHVACSFMIIMKEEVAESIHIYVLLVQKQGHYLYSPLRFHSWPLENPSWRVILYLAIIIIIL